MSPAGRRPAKRVSTSAACIAKQSLSLRGIEGRVQGPTLRVVFIFDKDGITRLGKLDS